MRAAEPGCPAVDDRGRGCTLPIGHTGPHRSEGGTALNWEGVE